MVSGDIFLAGIGCGVGSEMRVCSSGSPGRVLIVNVEVAEVVDNVLRVDLQYWLV